MDPKAGIKIFGLSQSGKLTYIFLRKLSGTLTLGNLYELMCHPGFFYSCEISDARLMKSHQWEAEYNFLTSNQMRALCTEFDIKTAW